MHDLELNKILAACLVAGIVASSSGFIAHKIVRTHEVKAAGAEASGGGGAAAAPEAPEPILELIAKADVEHGKAVAKACNACHNFDKGGPDGVGPHLWNVLTRGKAATDFAYSDDMAKHKGEKWAYLDLNHFIWKPKSYVPGTKMTFAGVRKAQDRADVIAFLRTLADSPAALPSDGEIAAEKKELGPKEEPKKEGDKAGEEKKDDKKAEGKGAEKTETEAKTAPAAAKEAEKAPEEKKEEQKPARKIAKKRAKKAVTGQAAQPAPAEAEKEPDAIAPAADAAPPEKTEPATEAATPESGDAPGPAAEDETPRPPPEE